METLLRRWAELTPQQRRRALAGSRPRAVEALASLAGRGEDRFARIAAARFARMTPLPEAIRTAGTLLEDADDAVAAAAQETLDLLADHAEALRGRQQEALGETLVRAAEQGHRPAMATLERLGPFWSPRVRTWLEAPEEASAMRLRSSIRSASDARSLRRAVAWLGVPAAAPGARAALRESDRPAKLARALEASHLLLRRERVETLCADPNAASAPLRIGVGSDSPTSVRLGRLRWVRLLDPKATGTSARDALTDPDPRVRFAAAQRLIDAMDKPSCAEALLDFAFDPDERVARSAALALIEAEPPRLRRRLDSLARSPHGSCRRLIRAEPQRQWERMLELRRWLDASPDMALAELRGRIREGAAADRASAILLARRLGALASVETDLLEAARDEDARVAATAVLALGRLWTAPARVMVAAAMAHEDRRVRANALEAIARRDPAAAAISGAVASDDARVRANAIRAAMGDHRDDAGVDHLEAMLRDDRPEHRRSALWVARRGMVRAVAASVERLAAREPDPVVRREAEACAQALRPPARAEPHRRPPAARTRG